MRPTLAMDNKRRVGESRAGQGWVAWGLVALVVGGLLLVAGQRGLAWRDDRRLLDDEKEAASAARAEVLGLIGITEATSEQDLQQLLDGATAEFRTELEGQAVRLRKALSKNKVTATGDVVSTGVVKLEDGRATVIVAAAGTVENTQTAKAEPRNYRLRVDLQQDDDRWLVSGLEFVA
jgi:Mce-associated membrane protein